MNGTVRSARFPVLGSCSRFAVQFTVRDSAFRVLRTRNSPLRTVNRTSSDEHEPRIENRALRTEASASGFTLIELMVVMSLIVLLASVGLYTYQNAVTRSKEAVLKENLFGMRDAIDQYYADKNKYPASLDDLVSEKYLRAIPVDQFTQAADWQTEMSEPDPSNPTAQTGIYDVKSASEGTALDGSKYADW